MSHNFI